MRNPKGSGNRSTEPYRVLENASQTQKGSETDIQTQKGSNLKESGTRNAEPERVWKPERGTLQGSGKRKTKTRKTAYPTRVRVFIERTQKGSETDIQTQKGSEIDIQTQKGSGADIQTQKGSGKPECRSFKGSGNRNAKP